MNNVLQVTLIELERQRQLLTDAITAVKDLMAIRSNTGIVLSGPATFSHKPDCPVLSAGGNPKCTCGFAESEPG